MRAWDGDLRGESAGFLRDQLADTPVGELMARTAGAWDRLARDLDDPGQSAYRSVEEAWAWLSDFLTELPPVHAVPDRSDPDAYREALERLEEVGGLASVDPRPWRPAEAGAAAEIVQAVSEAVAGGDRHAAAEELRAVRERRRRSAREMRAAVRARNQPIARRVADMGIWFPLGPGWPDSFVALARRTETRMRTSRCMLQYVRRYRAGPDRLAAMPACERAMLRYLDGPSPVLDGPAPALGPEPADPPDLQDAVGAVSQASEH